MKTRTMFDDFWPFSALAFVAITQSPDRCQCRRRRPRDRNHLLPGFLENWMKPTWGVDDKGAEGYFGSILMLGNFAHIG